MKAELLKILFIIVSICFIIGQAVKVYHSAVKAVELQGQRLEKSLKGQF